MSKLVAAMSPKMPIRALVVDDSAWMRRAITDTLSSDCECVVVAEAANGLEALELTPSLRPDLVVMDIRMPEMGGLEALPLLKEILPSAHVVLITAVLEPKVRQQASNLGAYACLEKGNELWHSLPDIVRKLYR